MIATRFNPLGKSFLDTPAMQYIQDGLVLHLDGIENVGYGRHDAESKVWVDLVSGRIFANLANATDLISFEDNYCYIKASNYSYLECPNCKDIQDVFDEEVLTVEIGCKTGSYESRTMIRNRGFAWSINRTPVLRLQNASYVPNSNIGVANASAALVVTRDINTNKTMGYKNGTLSMTYYKGGATNTVIDDDALRIGIGGYVWQSMLMYAYYIRLYNRVLTDEERAHNYAIDKERFGL